MKPILAHKRADSPDAVAVFGFFGGAAVLSAVPFGKAHMTCSSGTSDEGRRTWAEKMAAVGVAVVYAGLIACLGPPDNLIT
jgi:hypothetical protein